MVFLSYVSDGDLPIGQLVEVNVRNSLVWGIIFQCEKVSDDVTIKSSIENLKQIDKILPYIFTKSQRDYILIFSQNTFNSVNVTAQSFFNPLRLLTQKRWQELSNLLADSTKMPVLTSNNAVIEEPQFILDIHLTVRIMYLIRSAIMNKATTRIIILFPEKKFLQKTLAEFKANSDSKGIIVQIFTGDGTKSNQDTVWNLITKKDEPQIIFATRAGLFLPFQSLDLIILVDEANSMYIQDQNSLYFDTRDAVFLMYKAFSANVSFVSTLPSVRLYNFYPETVLTNFVSSTSNNTIKPLNVRITHRDSKNDNFPLFSNQLLGILTNQAKDLKFSDSEDQNFIMSDDED